MHSNFFKCGLIGWCFECFFTGIHSLFSRKHTLPCKTSLWMFIIYGLASLIKPLYYLIKHVPTYIRGIVYTTLIFFTEYVTGNFLKKRNACPWDYSKSKHNINGLIRLDYAPLWFIVGLIYERFLISSQNNSL